MVFALRDDEERLLDIGNRKQKIFSSSYLGELEALVWACKRTKAFRGAVRVVVCNDNHVLVEKWRSHSLYDRDVVGNLVVARDVRWSKFAGTGKERNAFPFKKDLSRSRFFSFFLFTRTGLSSLSYLSWD